MHPLKEYHLTKKSCDKNNKFYLLGMELFIKPTITYNK